MARRRRVKIGRMFGRRGRRRSALGRFAGARRVARSRRRNPPAFLGALGRTGASGLTAGFSMDLLKEAGIMVAGAIVNGIARQMLVSRLPSVIKDTPAKYGVGLVTAGLLGFGAGKVRPSWQRPIFIGALLGETARAYNEFAQPKVRALLGNLGSYLSGNSGVGEAGVGDSLDVSQAAKATALGEGELEALAEEDLSGLDDSMDVGQVQGAQTLSDDDSMSGVEEELAGLNAGGGEDWL